jgi:hypothetical protein
MPKSKKEISNTKKNKKAINAGSVTCVMQLNFGGGQGTGHGFSTVRSCAEPDGYAQAMASIKGKKTITSIRSVQNEWPCQNCKAFFEGKNVLVDVVVDPRSASNVYFDHWVAAGVIPQGHSPQTGLVLRYNNGEWQAGHLG